MKNLLTTLTIILFLTGSLFSQSPEGINYQATVRDASGNLMVNQSVTVILAIKKTSATGTNVYQETRTVTTNNFGGFSLVIGEGTTSMGNFSIIDWGGEDHFLNVNVNGNDLGTTQMMSVPYALHAKKATTADNLANPIWKNKASNGDVFTIGEPVIIGDSIENADKLTIVDNYVSTELVDLRVANLTNGGDVINMDVTTSGTFTTQFLECTANGNVKARLNTNGILNIDSSLMITDGEINRTKTTSANLVPIAYGYVSSTGLKSATASTSNWSVTKVTSGVYDITISGESFNNTNYTVLVTKRGSGSIYYSATGGKIRIFSRALVTPHSLADGNFSFIIYKP